MEDLKQLQFAQRLRRIDTKHRKLAKGHVTTVCEDGLVVARPQRCISRTPLRGLFLSLLAFLLFKGFIFARLGEAVYGERVALLQQGTQVERFGARVMKADPVTIWIASRMRQSK
jgi:hypothetical protein